MSFLERPECFLVATGRNGLRMETNSAGEPSPNSRIGGGRIRSVSSASRELGIGEGERSRGGGVGKMAERAYVTYVRVAKKDFQRLLK